MAGALALMLAYWAGWSWRDAPVPQPHGAVVKTGSVALLVVWAAGEGALGLAVAGGILGAVGDWYLARPGDRSFLAGMAAFAAGHLAYVALFVQAATVWPGWAEAVAVLALALSTELWLAPGAGALLWPVRGYVVVICAMLLVALTLPPGLILLGAALFVVSDLLLAVGKFMVTEPRLRIVLSLVLWPVYWLAQLMILAGSLSLGA